MGKKPAFENASTLAQETGNLALLCEEPVFVFPAPSLKKQETWFCLVQLLYHTYLRCQVKSSFWLPSTLAQETAKTWLCCEENSLFFTVA